MNKYGRQAMSHWERTDPDRYQAIPNKDAFFTELGEQAELRIQDLADSLAGPDRPGETYLQKVGRLNMARLAAEEQVLAEMVLIAEPRSSEDEDLEEGPSGTLQFMRNLGQAMRETEENEPPQR